MIYVLLWRVCLGNAARTLDEEKVLSPDGVPQGDVVWEAAAAPQSPSPRARADSQVQPPHAVPFPDR